MDGMDQNSEDSDGKRRDTTVELILVLVVIIGLVIIFKKQLNELVTKIFEKITNESSGI